MTDPQSSQLLHLDALRSRERWLLVVMDACRWDYLRALLLKTDNHDLHERCLRVRSPALTSTAWARACWRGDWSDVTYITANAFFTDRRGAREPAQYRAGNHLGTIRHIATNRPEGLVKRAREDRSADRIVVHLMQPHEPYFTTEGERAAGLSKEDDPPQAWRSAYAENLAYGWHEGVEPLLEMFDRPTVVTADHGEAFGRNDGEDWHHGPGMDHPEVGHVPWLPVNYEPGTDLDVAGNAIPEERLRELGYIE